MTESFRHIKTHNIESLNVDVEHYEHIGTGAAHYHLKADNPENVFLVALRTVPTDSTGVAHILEHTSLCGSEKYPVRDPFFMMIRRSLNTFMNAFTSSDWTAYPFASQNRKDFNNLLEVYLDAVFFARLDELDFLQEGHRVEFSEPADPSSPLVFKGVVFNEMKGAMSSPVSVLWQTLTEHLFPDTTYHYNSGGEPKCIPDLTYDELKAFYKKHYHPSNAIFMTFGDMDASELQQKFEENALSRFSMDDERIDIGLQSEFDAPKVVDSVYALQESTDDLKDKTHVVLGWRLGESTDIGNVLRAHLLSSVLLDNSASPLRDVLETSTLGQAPSPLCGLEDSNRQMTFACGLEGANAEDADAIEAQIVDTLTKVAEEGVPQGLVDAAIHQLELSQREIGGDSYPYGLQLVLSALGAAVHRSDPVAALDVDQALEALRSDISDPEFIKSLVREWLLENNNKVKLTLRPDPDKPARDEAEERARLDEIAKGLTDLDKRGIVSRADALLARQNEQDDESVLPKVTLADVPDSIDIPIGEETEVENHRVTRFARGTNGICYQQVVIDLPPLTDDELLLLPQYTNALTELGIGDRDYREIQALQSAVTGGVASYADFFGKIDDVQDVTGYMVLSGKALSRNSGQLMQLLHDNLSDVRFDEHARIRELVAQRRMQRERSITGSGHTFAMLAASSRYSPIAHISQRLRGLTSIQRLKELDESLADTDAVAAFADRLGQLHEKLLSGTRQFLLVGESDSLADMSSGLADVWQGERAVPASFTNYQATEICEPTREAWVTSTQVNFCAKAYPTVPSEHPDAPALAVLGVFLKNGFLHRVIREQGGAYGGGASHDSSAGVFRFYSYRDPRLVETLADFDQAIDWMLTTQHEPRALEEAVLGVISAVDKPGSPAGDAKHAYHYALQGRSREKRLEMRRRLLQVSIEDLKRVTRDYLVADTASVAIVTSPANESVAEKLSLDIQRV